MGVSENLGTKMRNGDDDKPLDFGGTFPIGLFFLANQKGLFEQVEYGNIET